MATNPRALQEKAAQLAALQKEFNTYVLNTELTLIQGFANETLFPIFQAWQENVAAQEDFRGWVKTQGIEKEARFDQCLTLFQNRGYLNGFVLNNEGTESESDDDEFMQHLVASSSKAQQTPPQQQLGMFGTAATYVGLGSLFGYPHTPPISPLQTLKRPRNDSPTTDNGQPAAAVRELFPAGQPQTPPNAAQQPEQEERLRAEQERERLRAQQQAEQAIKIAEEARMEASRKAAEDLQRQQAEQNRQAELLFKQQQEQQAREAATRRAAEDAAQKEAARIAELRRQMAIEGF